MIGPYQLKSGAICRESWTHLKKKKTIFGGWATLGWPNLPCCTRLGASGFLNLGLNYRTLVGSVDGDEAVVGVGAALGGRPISDQSGLAVRLRSRMLIKAATAPLSALRLSAGRPKESSFTLRSSHFAGFAASVNRVRPAGRLELRASLTR